jgi:hypothetical protein
MKYKTQFRMMLKAIGVFVFVLTVPQFMHPLYSIFRPGGLQGASWTDYAIGLISPGVQIALASYLFFGGKWITDIAIPGNRPYCHECGYDLTNASGHVCSECGTPFKPEVISPP